VGDGELPAAVAPDAGEAVEGGIEEMVTPARAQVSWAVFSACARSAALQLAWKQVVVELMKSESSHRHFTSPAEHLEEVALAKQPLVHAGYPS